MAKISFANTPVFVNENDKITAKNPSRIDMIFSKKYHIKIKRHGLPLPWQ